MSQKTKRESSGFLIKQRAFLKVFLLTKIEEGRSYGLQLQDDLQAEFAAYGFTPHHAEVYRSLHELMEEGLLSRGKVIMEGKKYKEIAIYSIADPEKVKAYKKLVKADLDRCIGLLNKAVRDNYA